MADPSTPSDPTAPSDPATDPTPAAPSAAPSAAPPTPYVLDEQIGYLLRLASQRHSAIFQKNTILDLTATQYAALVRLFQVGQCSQNKLGRLIGADIATTKGVVDRLRDKGLVESRRDPDDKRRALLSVVPGQEHRLGALHQAGQEISRQTLAPLSTPEAEQLLHLLRRLT